MIIFWGFKINSNKLNIDNPVDCNMLNTHYLIVQSWVYGRYSHTRLIITHITKTNSRCNIESSSLDR